VVETQAGAVQPLGGVDGELELVGGGGGVAPANFTV
jgi:hypothetical protein